MVLAVRCHARPHDLAEAIDIVGMDSQLTLDLGPHLIGPWLRTIDGCLQLDLIPYPHLLNGLRYMQQVGGGAHDACHSEIHHHGNQLLCISSGHGNHSGPHLLRPVMGSQAAGEQTVSVCHLDGVIPAQARHGDTPCHTFAPDIDVLAGIAHHSCLSRGAAGCMDTGDL